MKINRRLIIIIVLVGILLMFIGFIIEHNNTVNNDNKNVIFKNTSCINDILCVSDINIKLIDDKSIITGILKNKSNTPIDKGQFEIIIPLNDGRTINHIYEYDSLDPDEEKKINIKLPINYVVKAKKYYIQEYNEKNNN